VYLLYVFSYGQQTQGGPSRPQQQQQQPAPAQQQPAKPAATAVVPIQQSQQQAQPTAQGGNSSSGRQTTYPWQTVRLTQGAPVVFPRPGVTQPTTVSPLPFPRYGHSLPATANAAGELYIFGGLVRDSVRDDLYCIDSKNLQVKLVNTIGEVPSPRVGHASALVSSVLIVWGGDTNSKDGPGEPQDDSLYLLNLGQWPRRVASCKPAKAYSFAISPQQSPVSGQRLPPPTPRLSDATDMLSPWSAQSSTCSAVKQILRS